jgi:hypothetical protein
MQRAHQRLDQHMAAFVRTARKRDTLDAATVLSELTAGAVELMPSVEHASITLAHNDNVTTQSSTGPFPTELDKLHQECGTGPFLSTAGNGDIVRVDDVERDIRWPQYSRAVVERTPIRSILSLALDTDAPGRGALNLYAEKPNAFDVGITDTALIYASYAAMAWLLARRDDQFHRAIASRDIIGQAKGIVMERYAVDADEAFALLARLSQSSNMPLAQVATGLVEFKDRK